MLWVVGYVFILYVYVLFCNIKTYINRSANTSVLIKSNLNVSFNINSDNCVLRFYSNIMTVNILTPTFIGLYDLNSYTYSCIHAGIHIYVLTPYMCHSDVECRVCPQSCRVGENLSHK